MTETPSTLVERADALRALHKTGDPLVLPNAWDAGSARAVVAAGFPVVATSSAAVADSLGYADGEDTPADEMFAAVARIVRAVPVPVTADLERGYGLSPTELVERMLAAGVVGCNLEDSDPRTGALYDAEEQAELLAAVRAAAGAAGVPLVLNARIDLYLRGAGDPAHRTADAVRRARRYREAGADCVYPIALADPGQIAELVAGAEAPVNLGFKPGVSSLAELARLGAARVSFGPGPYHVSKGRTVALLDALRAGGNPYAPPSA
ncbi:Carboxyvinyl-carboxyphosphonate phosphorylmutase [Micromonospora sp. MW-13]|uniref:isocitrate lyase/PEP mutase family protein n=1 Tax=Micromonospora sp. MW-13 TaxID=2094022 RepID=UPI000E445127|nr:isocitrate lyase/phosphoenolpyruvate mutase family protein [Micromonospora sp. MW-13]RGC70562.1 Carboxyvinyl-carboxyphosphonate phosphorylmutase [Micromonospora sp. MW-13]